MYSIEIVACHVIYSYVMQYHDLKKKKKNLINKNVLDGEN